MAGARPYRKPWYAADVRELRGRGWVLTDRDHGDGTAVYRVVYVSGGGDIYFKSKPIAVAEHADAACRVFCEFVGAAVDQESDAEVARETSAADLTGAP